jgi:hypothetical protein
MSETLFDVLLNKLKVFAVLAAFAQQRKCKP